ncbi:PstS family phosphate ABC transporter substrate-binding protein [Aminipila butyrica]
MVPFLNSGEEKEGEPAKTEEEAAKAEEEEKEPVEGIAIGGTGVLREYFAPALAAYMEVEEKEAKAFCSSKNYSDGYKELIAGKLQILFTEAPTDKENELAEKAGLELKSVPILNGGLVFLINEANPVKDLTLAQIQGIYDGTITNWKDLGGEDLPIIAYQRSENTGGQSGLYKYVLSKEKLEKTSRKLKLSTTADLAEAVAAEKGAIGYTYYYYVNKLETSEGTELAAVNSIEPNADTIGEGQYPLTTYTYAVIAVAAAEEAADSQDSTKEPAEEPSEAELKAAEKLKTEQQEQLRANLRFIQWILREDGQALAADKGFVKHND